MMITSVLVAYVALAFQPQAAGERTARPTDDQILAAVAAEAPQGRILSSAFHDTPRGGARAACGLIEINGAVEPFSALAIWKDARPERQLIRSVSVRGEDGRMQEHALPPLPPEPAGWDINHTVATHVDSDGDGIDRGDRNRDTAMRKLALTICGSLTPPDGTTWVTELEPDPDPRRQARNERLARTMTDLLFGGGSSERR